jgi:hypothetical protein
VFSNRWIARAQLFRRFLPYAAAIVVKLWLISGFSITAIYAPHDDYLFVRQALSILDGKWLGPFYHLTLAKGPFFSIWLAAMNMLALPYALALQISYLLACLVFVIGLRDERAVIYRPYSIFLVLWFSPASFVASDFRVERSSLYPSLVLLTIAFATGLAIRNSQRIRTSLVWPIGLGLSFASFWLTREEGVWLLPSLMVIVVGALFYGSVARIREWALSATLACLCIALVAGANHFWYGRFMVIETRDAALVDAYRAITRVGDNSPRLMVPMSAKAIEKAAAASPAFTELRPFILSGYPSWRNYAKTVWAPMYPDGLVKQTLMNDSEAIGGYFVWDFMAAVEQAGHYTSAAAAHDYYLRLATEINAACDSARIACHPGGEDLIPGWKALPGNEFISSFKRAVLMSVMFPPVEFSSQCENVDPVVLTDFRLLTRSPIECRDQATVSLRGWVLAKNGDASLVASSHGTPIWRLPKFIASPDVAAHFAGTEWQSTHAENARFETQLTCADCDLALEVNGITVKSAPVSQWQPGCPEGAGWQMCIDAISKPRDTEPRLVNSASRLRQAMSVFLGVIYRYGVASVAGVAFLVTMLRIRHISDRRTMAFLFAASCILAVIVRAFLLAWVDVVSFPTVLLQYSHASYVLLLAGTVFLVLAATNEK